MPEQNLQDPKLIKELEAMAEDEKKTPGASETPAAKIIPRAKSREKGSAQEEHEILQVENLGWHDDSPLEQPLIGFMDNEDVWALIRRFNKQISHVKSVKTRPLTNLDMNIAPQEDLSLEKLQMHAERLYMTLVISLVSFNKHMIRLRSWREWQRTLCFMVIYFTSWTVDLLATTVIAYLIILIIFPSARRISFPSAPLSIVEPKPGVLQKPLAGEAGPNNSATGTMESYKGETIEQEARSFVKSVGHFLVEVSSHPKLIMEISSGQYSGDDRDSSGIAQGMDYAQAAADGMENTQSQDDTQQPVSRAVNNFNTRSALQTLPDLADTWERLANALNPTASFPIYQAKLRLAACLLPLLALSYLNVWYFMIRVMALVVGLVFFGNTSIERCLEWMDTIQPGWRKLTQLRNTLLQGVPTNIQLAITILRIAERNKSPFPPPPNKAQPANSQNIAGVENLDHLEPSQGESRAAPSRKRPHQDVNKLNNVQQKHNMTRRLASRIQRTTQEAVRGILKLNESKEGLISGRGLQNRINFCPDGPVQFAARYEGRKGFVNITSTAKVPAISWKDEIEHAEVAWTVAIMEISELKKVGGLGWKRKMLVRLSMDDEVKDGLVVRTVTGQEYYLATITLRDELFNRLAALGDQMWEVM